MEPRNANKAVSPEVAGNPELHTNPATTRTNDCGVETKTRGDEISAHTTQGRKSNPATTSSRAAPRPTVALPQVRGEDDCVVREFGEKNWIAILCELSGNRL